MLSPAALGTAPRPPGPPARERHLEAARRYLLGRCLNDEIWFAQAPHSLRLQLGMLDGLGEVTQGPCLVVKMRAADDCLVGKAPG